MECPDRKSVVGTLVHCHRSPTVSYGTNDLPNFKLIVNQGVTSVVGTHAPCGSQASMLARCCVTSTVIRVAGTSLGN
jgi:hypothetical protein